MGVPAWIQELALARNVSAPWLEGRVRTARRVLAIPALLACLDDGVLGEVHVRRVLDALRAVPDDLAAVICANVLPPVGTVSPAELAQRVTREWMALDADAVARARRAAVSARRMWVRHGVEPGVSSFGATARMEDVKAVQDRIEQAARRPVGPDDHRTVEQRRVDIMTALLQRGRLDGVELPDAQVQLALHAAAETLTGESDEPGLLVGAGLIDADRVRELARGARIVKVCVDGDTRAVLARDETPAGTSRPPKPQPAATPAAGDDDDASADEGLAAASMFLAGGPAASDAPGLYDALPPVEEIEDDIEELTDDDRTSRRS